MNPKGKPLRGPQSDVNTKGGKPPSLQELLHTISENEDLQADRLLLLCKQVSDLVVETKQVLKKHQCEMITTVFKKAMAKRRTCLKSLKTNLELQVLHDNQYTEALRMYITIPYGELESIVQIARDTLTPIVQSSNLDDESQIIILKSLCDSARYLVEFGEGESYEKNYKLASEGYEDLMQRCSKLRLSSEVKVGVLLNFAVFLYEHADQAQRAVEIGESAIRDNKADGVESGDLYLGLLEENIAVWKNKKKQLPL